MKGTLENGQIRLYKNRLHDIRNGENNICVDVSLLFLKSIHCRRRVGIREFIVIL